MTLISGINSFQEFEIALSTAKASVSMWGNRIVSFGLKNELGIDIKHQITIPTLIDNVKLLYQRKLPTLCNSDKESCMIIVTHLIDKLINDCQSSIKNNCLKRIVLAIRDFFTCFFKKLQNNLKEIDHLLHSHQPSASTTNTKIVIPIAKMKDLFSREIKKYLAPTCYASLTCTNKMMRAYMLGIGHLSFNHFYFKLCYSITTRPFVRTVIPAGIIDVQTDLTKTSNRYLLHKNHLIHHKSNVKADTFELIKYSIHDGRVVNTITSIPKEAFFPPESTDQIKRCGEIQSINQDFFYSRHVTLISVWHCDSMKAVYAVLFPSASFIDNKKIVMVSKSALNQIDVKQLTEHEKPPITYNVLSYSDGIPEIDGDYFILNGSKNLTVYCWKTGAQVCSLDTNGYVEVYVITGNFIFYKDKDCDKKIKKIEISTGNISEIEGPHRLRDRQLYQHLMMIPGDDSIWIIDCHTGELLQNFTARYLFNHIFFTSIGTLAVIDYHGIAAYVYDPLTGTKLYTFAPSGLEHGRRWGKAFVNHDILFMPVVTKGKMLLIDLLKYKVIGEHDIGDNEILLAENGCIVAGNEKTGIVQVDNFNMFAR